MTNAQRAPRVLPRVGVDPYFATIALVAFLSGGCFGFFAAGRAHRLW